MQAYILSINGYNAGVILRNNPTAMASAICQAAKDHFAAESAEIITDIPDHSFSGYVGEVLIDGENYDFVLENVTIY